MSADAIKGLKPELVWNRFYEITQIPHPSKKEEKICEYLRNFANDKNLEFKEDEVGNIVMKVPATPGCENAPIVVMQGHVDMVCEKNKGTEHDFENDPLKVFVDGEWFTAEGTTLGADNGIGVAAALAMVDEKDAVHGPLELLFTVDEETGMTGVNGLQPGFVDGRILLNMDSEEDGVFYVGCAGGIDTVGFLDIKTTDVKSGFVPYELMVTGLKGGHSGLDIVQGRANAIKFLGRLLNMVSTIDFQITDVSGGSLRNAIPREAEVTLLINPSDETFVKEKIEQFITEAKFEFKVPDPQVEVKFSKKDTTVAAAYTDEFAANLLNLIYAVPHGVMTMNPEIPGLVDTSTNLATITVNDNVLRLGTSQRSSIESAKVQVARTVKSALELGGARVETGDGYPGWAPNMESELLKTARKVYTEMYKEEAEMKAIHAGLECGLLGAKYPGMDMISYGPTIQGAHSPDERLNIKDTEKFYNLTKGLLKALAGK